MEQNYRIINSWIKTYLIGAMSKTQDGDGGAGWRDKIQQELEKRIDKNGNPIYIFNPCNEEQNKVGLNPIDYHKKVNGWINAGLNDKVAEGSDLIWQGKQILYLDENNKPFLKVIPGDDFYVEQSDFLICRINPLDKPCVGENTLVTMSDYTQKKIKDIKVGDKILGVKTINKQTYFVESNVFDVINQGKKFCHTFIGDNNKITCTLNHKFMKVSKKCAGVYKSVKEIIKKKNKVFEINFSNTNKDFYRGWIKGYCLHDFHFKNDKHGVCATCISDKKEEIEKLQKILNYFSIYSRLIKKQSYKDKRFNTQKDFYYHLYITNKKDYIKLRDIVNTSLKNKNQYCGFITGSIDADGYYDEWNIGYSQNEINLKNYKLIVKTLEKLNIKHFKNYRERKTNISQDKISKIYEIKFSKNYIFLFPSQFDYKRKLKNFTIKSTVNHSSLKKYYYSYNTVYDLTTETGNYIANGFIVHNCGTYYEAGYCRKLHKPLYVLQTMKREDYSESFVGWVFSSGGMFFKSENELLEFLDEKYELKKKDK